MELVEESSPHHRRETSAHLGDIVKRAPFVIAEADRNFDAILIGVYPPMRKSRL
jgi:hypothetical protein